VCSPYAGGGGGWTLFAGGAGGDGLWASPTLFAGGAVVSKFPLWQLSRYRPLTSGDRQVARLASGRNFVSSKDSLCSSTTASPAKASNVIFLVSSTIMYRSPGEAMMERS